MKITAALAVILFTSMASYAQEAQTGPWITNGNVNTISIGDGKIFLGGLFDWAGPAYGSAAAVFDTSLANDPSYAHAGQNLRTAIKDDAGGWYIAGDRKISHLKSDKTLEELPIDVEGYIYALAKIGSTLYIGGSFTMVNTTARTSLASFDLTTNTLTAWNPNPNGSIETIKESGSIVYAGGNFTTIGGQARLKIAALDASTGLATAWNANVAAGSGTVRAITFDAGAVYFGGNFSNAGSGTPARTNFAAVNTTTGALLTFNPRPNSFVYDLLLDGTTLYLAGNFSQIAGIAKEGFAALNVTTGAFTSFAATFSSNPDIKAFAIDGQKLFIGGAFTTVNGEERPRLAALDKTTGASEPMDDGKISQVPDVLVVSSGHLLAVSEEYFNGVSGVALNSSAVALDEATGQHVDWTPEIPSPTGDGYLASMSLHYDNSRVYYLQRIYHTMDGYYETVLGAVSAVDGTTIGTWSVDVDDEVQAWAFSDDALYLAGKFTDVNGTGRAGFAAVDLETGTVLPWTINFVPGDGQVSSMAVYNDVLYVAGEFFVDDNGEERVNLASWDAENGVLTNWKPADLTDLGRLRIGTINDTHVYVLGNTAQRVDAVSGERDAIWQPPLDNNNEINAMVVYDGFVYLGGSFGDSEIAGLIRFDEASGEFAGTQPVLNDAYSSEGSAVNAIVLSGTKLMVGGGFYYEVNGILRSNYAEYLLSAPTNNQPPQILTTTAAVLIQNIVTIDLLPLITDPDDNLDLSTLELKSGTSEHGASASLDGSLLTLDYGAVAFHGTDQITIGVCDLLNECVEQELAIEVTGDVVVYNAVSPNGDSKNEVLTFQYIEAFGQNKVTIFNRWGDLVFEVLDYNNADRSFKGLNKNGNELPSGTYFYTIEFMGGKKAKTGYLSLRK